MQRLRFKFKDWMFLIIIPLLLITIWFHSGLITGGGEEGLAFYDSMRTSDLSKIMWWDYDAGFPTLAWLPHINLFFFLSLLQKAFHIPNYLLEAGTFFILLVTGGVSVYFLTKELLIENNKTKYVPLITAIFYIFNPFSMSQIWGRGLIAQFFCFALLPLSLLLFIRGLKYKNMRYAFLLAISSTIFSSAFGVTTFVIAYWVVLTTVFLSWCLLTKAKKKDILFYIVYFILSFTLWGMCSANWLLPTVIEGSKIYSGSLNNAEENIGTLLGVSRNYPPHVLIRLLQDTYFFAPSAFSPMYAYIPFQLISFLFPFFLCLGLFLVMKKKTEFKNFQLFGILLILGLVVSLGANPPLGWLFVWIFQHFPFLQGFRNPYEKFGIVYALAYAPIFSLGAVYFSQYIIKKKKLKLIVLLTILLLLCGIYVWPMWTGKILGGHNTYVGIDVPDSYQEMNNWLERKNTNYRVAMTPFWSGDGAFYQWGNSKYQGLDPTMYLLDAPTIPNNPSNFPYFSDFMKHIRENIYKKDVSGALALFRVQYLISRKDAINISPTENLHTKFLTDTIYPPSKTEDKPQVFCQEKVANAKGTTNPAWISCELKGKEKDFHKAKYLHVTIKVDVPANLDLAIKDTQENRPRWYGKDENTYFLPAKTWTTLVLPLGVPTEVNNATDFKNIELVEIFSHPVNRHSESVDKIEIKEIWLDNGEEKKINNFKFIKTFDNLQIYESTNTKTPPEFGFLTSIETVDTFDKLIETSQQRRQQIDKHGFILTTQNEGKELKQINKKITIELSDSKRISDTKYWIKIKEPKEGLLILSQKFHPEWKVIPGVDKNELNGNFFNNLQLLTKSFLNEKDHYVINGYANLWKLDGKSGKYAIIFIPQLYADLGVEVTKYGLVIICAVGLILLKK